MTKKQPAHPRTGADYRSALTALIRKKISQLTPVEFMLAVHVYACLEDEEGPVRSSIAELAAATGLSCRTVQSCRAHLIRSGILELNSTSRERSAYDLPRTLPPAAVEPEQAQPAIAPAKPALPAPLPHQSTPSILVDAPAEENARIAWLLEKLGGNTSYLNELRRAARDDQSKLLQALESIAISGPRPARCTPGMLASIVSHKFTLLNQRRSKG